MSSVCGFTAMIMEAVGKHLYVLSTSAYLRTFRQSHRVDEEVSIRDSTPFIISVGTCRRCWACGACRH